MENQESDWLDQVCGELGLQRGAEVMGKVWTGGTIFSIIDKKSHVMMIHNVLEMQSEISRKERKALEKELPWT